MREIWDIHTNSLKTDFSTPKLKLAKGLYKNAREFIFILEESREQNKLLHKNLPTLMETLEEQDINDKKVKTTPSTFPIDNESWAILGLYALNMALVTRLPDWLERAENLCGKASSHDETLKKNKTKSKEEQKSETASNSGQGNLNRKNSFTELVKRIVNHIEKTNPDKKYNTREISEALKFIGETLNGNEAEPDEIDLNDSQCELIELRTKSPQIDIFNIYMQEDKGINYFNFSTRAKSKTKDHNRGDIVAHSVGISGSSEAEKKLRDTIHRVKKN